MLFVVIFTKTNLGGRRILAKTGRFSCLNAVMSRPKVAGSSPIDASHAWIFSPIQVYRQKFGGKFKLLTREII
jgi:hypothetical protein